MHTPPSSAGSTRPATLRPVETVRAFNRLYTRQLGLLNRRYLGSGLSLTEARVLYELASRKSSTARDIARDLGIDVAYLSRILAGFRQRRWVARTPSIADRRQHWLKLTSIGRAAFAPLNASAAEQARRMLSPIAAPDRQSLVGSMRDITRILARDTSAEVRLRGLQVGDVGWIVHRQAVLYAQEYGWDMSYEALIAGILSRFVSNYDPLSDAAWIAEQDGRIVGSVFLVRASRRIGRLRLLYVEPCARGMGLGRRLVGACIDGARQRGYRSLTLWTNDVLVSARRIYEAAGFGLVKEERHRSFGKELTGQTWSVDLVRRAAASA